MLNSAATIIQALEQPDSSKYEQRKKTKNI